MMLKKKLTEKTLASATYIENGIALRASTKGDKYLNAVAILEVVDGKPQLVIFDNAVKRYGLSVKHEISTPEEW